MYHDNKIALFISHIYGSYQSELCQGVIRKALEYGYRTEIYCSNDGENLGDYGTGEENILRIPNFNTIDGVIFASSSYVDDGIRGQITQLLKEQTCPVVEVGEICSFPSAYMENHAVFQTLTEHLISVHGAKRVCYLGSAKQLYYSDKRQEYVKQVLLRHGLPFTERELFLCDESAGGYEAALAHFTGNGRPDAVVCYNDHMALGFCVAAIRAGYRIPEDFAVTGCDNTAEGQNMDPPLTGVTYPSRQLGEAAAASLMEHMRGQGQSVVAVTSEPVIAGSCGCRHPRGTSAFLYQQELSDVINRIEGFMVTTMQMAAEFSHITDIDEGIESMVTYVHRIQNCSEFYLCLYPGWDEPSAYLRELINTPAPAGRAEDSVLLKLAICRGTRLPECSFQKNRLLPDFVERDSDAAYIVSPLFFETRFFGYTVMAFADNRLDYHFHYVHWLTNITQLLQNIYEYKRLHALSSQLENIYAKDALTGLYNRYGFINRRDALLHSVEGVYTAMLMFDLDHLKAINGSFGHHEGDFALRAVSQALRGASRQEDLCARFEGDEFYVLAKVNSPREAEELLQRVCSYLANFNKLSSKPYLVSASGGLACVPSDSIDAEGVERLMIQADGAMRRAKREKPVSFLRSI